MRTVRGVELVAGGVVLDGVVLALVLVLVLSLGGVELVAGGVVLAGVVLVLSLGGVELLPGCVTVFVTSPVG
jgi:hypothetical protein